MTGIYRVKVPLGRVYTSVFLLSDGADCIVADAACTEADINGFVLPEIAKTGLRVAKLFVSHDHFDHSGGFPALRAAFPNAETVLPGGVGDGETLLGDFRAVRLPGHTADHIGIFDSRSNALVTFDGLQLCGIDVYGIGLESAEQYRETIEKVRKMRVNALLASHEYVPLGSEARGTRAVEQYLDACGEAIDALESFARTRSGESPERIAEEYNALSDENPPIGAGTVAALYK